MKKRTLSSETLIIAVSIYIASVTNLTFWRELFARLDIFSIQGFGYVFTSFFVIVFVISTLFFSLGHKRLLKPILIAFLILSATIAYFNHELGVIIDKEMVRNIVETIKDYNVNEARELLSYPLFFYILIFGVLPSIAVILVNTRHDSKRKMFLSRGLFAISLLTIALSTFILNNKFYTYFYRGNEDLLAYVTPIYPIVAVKKYIKRQMKEGYVFHEVADDVHRAKPNKKRTVGIMVVGETARADHFSLSDYQRQTNPTLSRISNLIYFKNTHSCGTSTAYSVPCMFSFFDEKNYSPEKAQQYSNVLDVLEKSDVKVVWEENNSSCKGVCARVKEINLIGHKDKKSAYYIDGQYYDEVMLDTLGDVIKETGSDVLLVLHTMGSHGPKYFNRYPESAAVFKPFCKSATPQECNKEEIVNAYDNTILYTDHFLGLVIDYLEKHKSSYDSFMIYASDHGESLGENGIYLHGLPNFIAPEAQTHIPFFMWFSNNFADDNNIDLNILKQRTEVEYSHDNLSHTLLGIYGIETSVYDKDLDILNQAIRIN